MPNDSEHAYPRPGEILEDKYAVERLVGEGAMGAVFQATHLLRQAPVALKFMSPMIVDTPGIVERFLNEGVAASRINNEHVVAVLDVSKLPNGLPYLVMEYLEGENLEQLLVREGKPGLPDVARAVHFVLQVLRALQVAHRSGIVHRDLKPANCFVIRKEDDEDFIKILDFGISKVQPAPQKSGTQPGISDNPLNLTGVGAALGTPLYVSPEQARNPKNVDARSDLYSVAVMLYELLTGKTPFEPESGSLSELFMLLATATPVPLDELRHDLPPGFSRVVQRGLAKSPDERFQSSAEMAEALLPFADRRSEFAIRHLLQRPSLGARPVVTSPPPPATAQRVAAVPRTGPLLPSEAEATQRGWPSEPPPARATAPGVGLTDTLDERRATQRPKRVSPAVWVALGLGAVALGGVLALTQGPGSGDAASGKPTPAASAVSEPGTSAAPTSTAKAAGAPSAEPAVFPSVADAGADEGVGARGAPSAAAQHAAPARPSRAAEDGEPSRVTEEPADGRKGPPGPPSKLRLRDIGRDRGSGGR